MRYIVQSFFMGDIVQYTMRVLHISYEVFGARKWLQYLSHRHRHRLRHHTTGCPNEVRRGEDEVRMRSG